MRAECVKYPIHFCVAFPNGEAANAIAGETDFLKSFNTFYALVFVKGALYYAK